MIERLARRDIVAKYLWFIAGLQIAAAVALFVNVYFIDLPLRKFFLIVVAGLVLGVSSFVSLMLASEIEYVVKAGESMVGTTLEKNKDKAMNNELNKTVSMMFLKPMKRINKIRAIFCSDVFLSAAGLGITILSKP